jgi:hypothetical protein
MGVAGLLTPLSGGPTLPPAQLLPVPLALRVKNLISAPTGPVALLPLRLPGVSLRGARRAG